mmetsp:Transcript_100048/g.281282  ORF Transcript_100048/g.281282 Transcript_100048/m.281282 type:complete len:106 (+) Transcript_100048:254-571(+)
MPLDGLPPAELGDNKLKDSSSGDELQADRQASADAAQLLPDTIKLGVRWLTLEGLDELELSLLAIESWPVPAGGRRPKLPELAKLGAAVALAEPGLDPSPTSMAS